MDQGILLISEDELDELFNENEDVTMPLDLMSGINIKTSCYGLFLVALEMTKDKFHQSLIKVAFEHIDNLTDSVAFHSMALMYPIDDLSLEGILGVAKAIILIDNITYGREAEDIEPGTIDTLMLAVGKELGLREIIIEMVTDDDQQKSYESGTSQDIHTELQSLPTR